MTTTIDTDKFVFVDFAGGSGRTTADKLDDMLYNMARYEYEYRRVVRRTIIDEVMFNNYGDARQYLKEHSTPTSFVAIKYSYKWPGHFRKRIEWRVGTWIEK